MSDVEREMVKRAEKICQLMLGDSRISLPVPELVRALQADYVRNGGHVPSEKECELLVMGDEDGEVPQEVRKRFRKTDNFLASFF